MVRTDGLERVFRGQPAERSEGIVGAAGKCLTNPQPVIGCPPQRAGPRCEGGQQVLSRSQLAVSDLVLRQPQPALVAP